jgi:hypothetical protein
MEKIGNAIIIPKITSAPQKKYFLIFTPIPVSDMGQALSLPPREGFGIFVQILFSAYP